MDKARIRTSWKDQDRKIPLEEYANALSSICWRLSINAARHLHQQEFVYHNDCQRLGVVYEYLVFLTHCADRLSHDYFDLEQRTRFMHALVQGCQRHYRINAQEMSIGNEPKDDFITRTNMRMDEYAATTFRGRMPGYDMYRLLGASIQSCMGEDQINRWVIDQIMDIDGPDIFEIFLKSMDKLKRNTNLSL